MGRSLFYATEGVSDANSICRLTVFGHAYAARAGRQYLRNEVPEFRELQDVKPSFVGESGLTLTRVLTATDYYMGLVRLTDPHIVAIDVLSNSLAKTNESWRVILQQLVELIHVIQGHCPRAGIVVMPCVPRGRRGLRAPRGDVDVATFAYRSLRLHEELCRIYRSIPDSDKVGLISRHVALTLRVYHLSRDGVHLKASGNHLYLMSIVRKACELFYVDYWNSMAANRGAMNVNLYNYWAGNDIAETQELPNDSE